MISTTKNKKGGPDTSVGRGPHPATSAIRTARWRERRQRGFKVYMIEVCDADLDGLIARCLLDRLDRNDVTAVERALGSLLDRLHR